MEGYKALPPREVKDKDRSRYVNLDPRYELVFNGYYEPATSEEPEKASFLDITSYVAVGLARTRVNGTAPRGVADAFADALGASSGSFGLSFGVTSPDRTTTVDGLSAELLVNRRVVALRDVTAAGTRSDDGLEVTSLGYRAVGSTVDEMRHVAFLALRADCDRNESFLVENFDELGYRVDHLTEGRGTSMVSRFTTQLDLGALGDEVTLIYTVDGIDGGPARTERTTLRTDTLIDRIVDRNRVKTSELSASWRVIASEEVKATGEVDPDDGEGNGKYLVTLAFSEPVVLDPRTERVTTPTGRASLTFTSGEDTVESVLETQRFRSRVAIDELSLPVYDACEVGGDDDGPVLLVAGFGGGVTFSAGTSQTVEVLLD